MGDTMSAEDAWCVEDLRLERRRCTFELEELTNLLDGGADNTAHRRDFESLFLSDPVYNDVIPQSFLSHQDAYENELKKACHTLRKVSELGIPYKDFLASGIFRSICRDGNPLALHLAMFVPALQGQASLLQQEHWLPRALRGEIIGTYAQTELGHGTFLRGLETTATLDHHTDQFVLHSPTVTATKWWPGGLGKTSNYAVVMAQLYTKGECHGPHPFLVQLRDEDTHQSLPGISIGEIGPKLGFNTTDNGFLRFHHHRIPRTHMLMKHSQVLKDGTYVRPSHDKLAYGTMVVVRVGIVRDMCKKLQCAVTIATRYSAVRRQSELVPGEGEPQILDYQTQQYKLVPQIASVFALHFAAAFIAATYTRATQSINEGDLKMLPELHVLSSGLKAISASDASEGVEVCRLACGGHGYLKSSNLPQTYANTTCAITYEGENTVLWLQVARSVIKAFRGGRDGRPLEGSMAYLADTTRHSPPTQLTDDALVGAFRAAALQQVSDAEAQLTQLVTAGQDPHQAWNNSSVLLVHAAQSHVRYFVCAKFLSNVRESALSEGSRDVVEKLCRLYLCFHIVRNPGHTLRSGFLTGQQVCEVEGEVCALLARLRPQAVAIVDSFDLHDATLSSTLGAWDGNVYERLYEEALKSPLNQTDVPEGYYKYLQPLLKSQL